VAKKEDNLIPFTSEQNREKAKINGKKGGIRSGEVRREKATMRKTLELLLDEVADIPDNENKLTYRQLATIGLLKGAIKGDNANYKTILETIGEMQEQPNETPNVQINIVDNSNLERIMYEEKE
jgi:hypothetical protein